MPSDAQGEAQARRVAAEVASEYGMPASFDAYVQILAYVYARANRDGYAEAAWKRCPECEGWGRTIKGPENATEPGPMGMVQKCATCGGTGAVRK